MTANASTFRLCFYVATAMLSAFTAGVMSVDFTDWRAVALFVAAIIGAGLTAARSYLDQSASQVVKDTLTKLPPIP